MLDGMFVHSMPSLPARKQMQGLFFFFFFVCNKQKPKLSGSPKAIESGDREGSIRAGQARVPGHGPARMNPGAS